MEPIMNQANENQGNAPQCARCRNFAPKCNMAQEDTPVLFGGLMLALNALDAVVRTRGAVEGHAPIEVARRYVREIARRVDEQAAKGSEAQSSGETPSAGNVGGEAGEIGPAVGPLFTGARFTEGV